MLRKGLTTYLFGDGLDEPAEGYDEWKAKKLGKKPRDVQQTEYGLKFGRDMRRMPVKKIILGAKVDEESGKLRRGQRKKSSIYHRSRTLRKQKTFKSGENSNVTVRQSMTKFSSVKVDLEYKGPTDRVGIRKDSNMKLRLREGKRCSNPQNTSNTCSEGKRSSKHRT
jgi:hypothetical protein